MRVRSACNERVFGHCITTWEIKNYSVVVWKEKNEVESPRFAVRGPGSLVTTWKLILGHDASVESNRSVPPRTKLLPEFESEKVETRAPKNCRLSFYLVRCDSGPNTVWVDWRVSCQRMGKEQLNAVGGETYFDRACSRDLNLGTVYDFEREFRCNDCLTFVCQMIVHERIAPESFDSSVDTDLGNLSEDFKSILQQDKFFDLELAYGEKRVYVHKAILYSRCKNFIDPCTNGECDVVYMIPGDYEGMLRILDYIYSGDLAKVVSRPSIALYDSILLMKLTELEKCFTPEEHNMLTKMNAEELSYAWPINNFSTRDEHCLSSPILTNDQIDTSWQIHLYPRGLNNQSNNISVVVENTEGKLWEELCIQCAVLREDKNLELWKILKKSTKKEDLFESDSFMNRETVIESLHDDLLRLGFNLTMCTEKMYSILGYLTDNYTSSSKLNPLEKLSDDMASLRQAGTYTDVVLRVENGEMKAHKCVLFARSRVLASLLEKEANCLTLSDIKIEILKVLIDYMYCAQLKVRDVDTLMDVYEAGEKLAISHLRSKCSRILQDSLSLENACDVLNLAHDYEDNSLKQKTIDFIRLNISDIRRQESWKELIHNEPTLCHEIDRNSFQPEEIATGSEDKIKNVAMENGNAKVQEVKMGNGKVQEVEMENGNGKVQKVDMENGNSMVEELLMKIDSIKIAEVERKGDNFITEEAEKESNNIKVEETEKESNKIKVEEAEKESNNIKVEEAEKESNNIKVEEAEKESNNIKVEEAEKESNNIKVEEAEKESNNMVEEAEKESNIKVEEDQNERDIKGNMNNINKVVTKETDNTPSNGDIGGKGDSKIEKSINSTLPIP